MPSDEPFYSPASHNIFIAGKPGIQFAYISRC